MKKMTVDKQYPIINVSTQPAKIFPRTHLSIPPFPFPSVFKIPVPATAPTKTDVVDIGSPIRVARVTVIAAPS